MARAPARVRLTPRASRVPRATEEEPLGGDRPWNGDAAGRVKGRVPVWFVCGPRCQTLWFIEVWNSFLGGITWLIVAVRDK